MTNKDLWMQLKDYREIPDAEPTDRQLVELLVDMVCDLRSRVDALNSDEEGIVRG